MIVGGLYSCSDGDSSSGGGDASVRSGRSVGSGVVVVAVMVGIGYSVWSVEQ